MKRRVSHRETKEDEAKIFCWFIIELFAFLFYININKKNKKNDQEKTSMFIIVSMIEMLTTALVDERRQQLFQHSCSEN